MARARGGGTFLSRVICDACPGETTEKRLPHCSEYRHEIDLEDGGGGGGS